MRRPAEALSQERLVLELKLALDADDWGRVNELIVANPKGTGSRHVQRNVGKRRAKKLNDFWRLQEGVFS